MCYTNKLVIYILKLVCFHLKIIFTNNAVNYINATNFELPTENRNMFKN